MTCSYDSPGNDLAELPASSLAECEVACNVFNAASPLVSCVAAVFRVDAQACYLKKSLRSSFIPSAVANMAVLKSSASTTHAPISLPRYV